MCTLSANAAKGNAESWVSLTWANAESSKRLIKFQRQVPPDQIALARQLLVALAMFSAYRFGLATKQSVYGLSYTVQGDVRAESSHPREPSILKEMESYIGSGFDLGAFALDVARALRSKESDVYFEMVRAVVQPDALKGPSIVSASSQHDQSSLNFTVDSKPASGRPFSEIVDEINRQIGLDGVKSNIEALGQLSRLEGLRLQEGLVCKPTSRHLVFTGNPGTGKTTMARHYADLLSASGALPGAHFIEADRSFFVGEFLGTSTLKTTKMIEEALGGVLFIDEAYSLIGQGSSPDRFGIEALNTLVKAMEDHRDSLVVILAGYPEEMRALLEFNPGMKSRIGSMIHFPDYADLELMQIVDLMVEDANYLMDDAARETIRRILGKVERGRAFGNARFVRNLLERAVAQQAIRLASVSHPSREQLMELVAEDWDLAWKREEPQGVSGRLGFGFTPAGSG